MLFLYDFGVLRARAAVGPNGGQMEYDVEEVRNRHSESQLVSVRVKSPGKSPGRSYCRLSVCCSVARTRLAQGIARHRYG
jgi:hypothetical protein